MSDDLRSIDGNPQPEFIDVTFRVQAKHADLWAAAKKLGSVRALADYCGVHLSTMHAWVKMKGAPSLDSERYNSFGCGEKRATLEKKLFEQTGKTLDDLFPAALRNQDFLDVSKDAEFTRSVEIRDLALNYEETLRLPSPDESASAAEISDMVRDAMRFLTKREREVLNKRNGMNGETPKTLDAIAAEIGLARERVRQIEVRAERKLAGRLSAANMRRDI